MFWIPLIGPIIQGIVSIFTKWQDTDLGKYKIDGSVDIEAMKTSANIIHTTKDDIGIRLLRDVLLVPPVVWCGIIGWDNIVVYEWPSLFIRVAAYPPSLPYLPFAAMTFLLGNIAVNAWRLR